MAPWAGQRGERSEVADWPARWSQSSNGTTSIPDLSYWGMAGSKEESLALSVIALQPKRVQQQPASMDKR